MSSVKLAVQQAILYPGNGYRLWKYAVIVADTDGNLYVKDGDHRCSSREEALAYAAGQTIGKARGLVKEEDILGVWDMTKDAIRRDPMFDPTLTDVDYKKGYDGEIRPFMPLPKKLIRNFLRQSSLELHPIPKERVSDQNWRSLLKFEWDLAHNNILQEKTSFVYEDYTARPWGDEMRFKLKKIIGNHIKKSNKSNKKLKAKLTKFLIAATTGSGKETGTLAALLMIHAEGFGHIFDESTLHGAFATIPDTALELIEELCSVSGMTFSDRWYADFSKFKVYVTQAFSDGYFKKLTAKAKVWARTNITVVEKVSDIPNHSNGSVALLLGSFVDIGLKSKLDQDGNIGIRYKTLESRIGILAVGEAHQFLSQDENKLWKQISNLNVKFLLPITGTPQDFIYNQDRGTLFFEDSNRVLVTRTQLYKLKRLGDPAYQHFPDINYYKLVLSDIIAKMKDDPRWNELNGLTWEKLLNSYLSEQKKFKYEDVLILVFRRLFGMADEFGEVDPLNIYSIRSLCDLAKRHILVGLPTGRDGVSAKVYITALVKLLKPYLGNVDILCAYEDNLDVIKSTITSDERPTITFTCRKNMVGTNIPAWGTILMLRKIGDSIKFFEQSTGRVVRVFPGKDNAGIFLGDLEAAINVTITVEQITNPGKGVSEIISEVLPCYNYMTHRNGVWESMDMPDLQEALESIARGGTWGISECIKDSTPPADFDLNFKDNGGFDKHRIELNKNGNEEAKNRNIIPSPKQKSLFSTIEKQKKSWRNMIKQHLAVLRKLCYIKGIHSRALAVKQVEKAIKEQDNTVLDMFGPGIKYFSNWANDSDQIDFIKVDRWIDKIHISGVTISQRLDMFTDKELQDKDTAFYAAGWNCAEMMAKHTLKVWKKHNKIGTPKALDPCGGSGSFLIAILELSAEEGVDLRPENCYYNDIDLGWCQVFQRLNKEFNLGIPENNITCQDATTEVFIKEYEMEFDLLLLNPAYQKDAPGKIESEEIESEGNENPSSNKQGDFWWKFVEPAYSRLLKPNGVIGVANPAGLFGAGRYGGSGFKLNNLLSTLHVTHIWVSLNHYFTMVTIPIVGWIGIKDTSLTSPTKILFEDSNKNFEIELKKDHPLPFHITETSVYTLEKCFNKSDEIMPFTEDIRSNKLTPTTMVIAINGGVYRDWSKIYIGPYAACPHQSKATGAVIPDDHVDFYKSLMASDLGQYLFYILGGEDKMSPTGILQRMLEWPEQDRSQAYSNDEFFDLKEISSEHKKIIIDTVIELRKSKEPKPKKTKKVTE